jgi:hypothetical protein
MIPHHVIVLTIVLIALWVLYRWGAAIFLVYAIAHFWRAEWAAAGLAFSFATFICLIRAWVSWLDWIAFGRRRFVRPARGSRRVNTQIW